MRCEIGIRFPLVCFLSFLLLTCREKDAVPESELNVSFHAQAEPAEEYPLKVAFTNTFPNANEYKWEFGDGRVSHEASPVIEYFSSGLFPVTLTIKKGNVTKSVTKRITVPFKRLSVALIYFIPKNVMYDEDLFKAIQSTSPLVQKWYSQQLGGRTYRVSVPSVDTIQGSQSSYTYGGGKSADFLKAIESEIYDKLGERIVKNEQVILVFYPLITPSFLGVGGVITKSEETRRIGIVGGSACQSITKSLANDQSLGLWTVAHELGHALGLSHNLGVNSLMFGPIDSTGYTPNVLRPPFPGCILTEDDKITLKESRFFH